MMPTYLVTCRIHGEQDVQVRLGPPDFAAPAAWYCPVCKAPAIRSYVAPAIKIAPVCGLQRDHVTGEPARTPTP